MRLVPVIIIFHFIGPETICVSYICLFAVPYNLSRKTEKDSDRKHTRNTLITAKTFNESSTFDEIHFTPSPSPFLSCSYRIFLFAALHFDISFLSNTLLRLLWLLGNTIGWKSTIFDRFNLVNEPYQCGILGSLVNLNNFVWLLSK